MLCRLDFFQQGPTTPAFSCYCQVVVLYAVQKGFADQVPPEEVQTFLEHAVSYVRQVSYSCSAATAALQLLSHGSAPSGSDTPAPKLQLQLKRATASTNVTASQMP